MTSPGMLQNPSVRKWLGGIEPAWTLLDQEGFSALRRALLPKSGAIRLVSDFSHRGHLSDRDPRSARARRSRARPRSQSGRRGPWLPGLRHQGRYRGADGGRPFKMTTAKLRLATAAMGSQRRGCAELGITRQTLYRFVSPKGELRDDGKRLLQRRAGG